MKIFELDNDIIISKVIFTKRVLIGSMSATGTVMDFSKNRDASSVGE